MQQGRGTLRLYAVCLFRIKGSRIGIESVLYEYVHRGQTPEAIAARFPSLTPEQVYATILWYLHDRERLTDYLAIGWRSVLQLANIRNGIRPQ